MNSLIKTLGVGALVLSSLFATEARAQSNGDIDIAPIHHYQTAMAYVNVFSAKKDTMSALIAIDNFEKYYISAPDGKMACMSLIRKALLLNEIERYKEAQSELNRLKQLECSSVYARAIKMYENMIKRRESGSTQ